MRLFINIRNHLSLLYFHITIVDVYLSALLSNEPYQDQTISVARDDAAIVEAK